jgi:flagellar FliJ protein
MPKFRFTLESVLRLRNQKRDECLRQLGLAIRRLNQIELEGQQILSEQAELRAYLKQLSQQGTVAVGMVSRCQMHLAQLGHKRQQVLIARDEAQRAVEIERARLIAAEQQVKVMEKLRDKKREEHQTEQDRKERLEQNEIQAAHQYRTLYS